MNLTSLIQAFFDGILQGGVYATTAIGLSLSFGVMRITNWAHGETLMASMIASYLLVTGLGLDPYLSIFIVAPLMFVFGYLIQRGPINYIISKEKDREPVTVLLFTAGLGTAMSYLAMMTFGSLSKMANTAYTGMSLQFLGFHFSLSKVISFAIAMVVTLVLYVFIQKSEVGRCMRATSQNREVVGLMGINEKSLYAVAMGIGSAITGIAGCLLVPYISVSWDSGLAFAQLCFFMVVLGGKGNILGCLLGSMIISLIQKIAGLYVPASFADIIVFVVFIIVLLFRPNGLLSKDKG